MRFPAGTSVRCVMLKWPDRPHWEWDAVYLGSDEYGDWLAQPTGTNYSRPGLSLVSTCPAVSLIPAGPWQAAFHAQEMPEHHAAIYVDVATPARWLGPVMTAVDLDLDVIRSFAGDVVVDDEDEFAEHRVSLGYPPELVDLAVRSCAAVHRDVLHERGPFDLAVSQDWLARVPG